jgi:glucan phosphorylase
MAHKVNGVSVLHTELMKTPFSRSLNRLHPDRIVNETNGVTPRRWLMSAIPRLASGSSTDHRRRTGSPIWSGWRSLSRISAMPPSWTPMRR